MRSVKRGVAWLLAFLVIQVSISVFLKIAADSARWRLGGTVAGALLAILSTFLLMRVFAHLPSHLAQGLGVGIGFMLSQFAIAALAHGALTPLQAGGAVLATVGMFLLSMPAQKKQEVRDVAGV
jgi:multidrug transporter EmrE-like cation transporter